MSESSSIFGPPEGGVAVADAPAETEAYAEPGSRRTLYVLLGSAVGLVLLLVGYFLFFAGGSSDETSGVVAGARPSTAPTSPAAPAASASPSAAPLPPTFDDTVGRDPFVPLASEAPPVVSTNPGGGTTAGTAPVTATTTTTTTSTTIALTNVADDASYVDVTVNGKSYKKVKSGGTAGASLQVYSIFNSRCAGFLYGDQPIQLCEGGTKSV